MKWLLKTLSVGETADPSGLKPHGMTQTKGWFGAEAAPLQSERHREFFSSLLELVAVIYCER